MSGVGLGPSLRNKSVKNVWGLRPHTFLRPHTLFTPLLCNLGPQTSSGHNFCTILIYFVFALYLGMGYYNTTVSNIGRQAGFKLWAW